MPDAIRDYRTIAAEKQLQRQGRIPQTWLLPKSYDGSTNLMDIPATCGILSDEECNITSNFDATAVLEKLKSGTWSAEQVTIAFCKRAAIAHQLVSTLFIKAVIPLISSLTLDQLSNGDLLRQGN